MQLAAPTMHPAIRGARGLFGSIAGFVRHAWGTVRSADTVDTADSAAHALDSSLARFQSALTDVNTRSVLRERLERGCGNECFEFLIAVRSFDDAGNSLQRYELLSNLVHRFVRDGADRLVPLSEKCRRDVLREWDAWSGKGRVPARVSFSAVEAATTEINTLLLVGIEDASAPPQVRRSDQRSASACFFLRFRALSRGGPGLTFPCDEEGNVTLDKLSERARANYLFARAMVGRDFAPPIVIGEQGIRR